MASRPAVEVHHQIPRYLLGLRDRADAYPDPLNGEGLQLWLDFECEALRYDVDPDASPEELAALIEGSTVETSPPTMQRPGGVGIGRTHFL